MAVTHHGKRELEACAACGRLVQDWHSVEYREDGMIRVALNLCRACATNAEDAVTRSVREAQ